MSPEIKAKSLEVKKKRVNSMNLEFDKFQKVYFLLFFFSAVNKNQSCFSKSSW